jgi:hypothetical protein
MTIKQRQGKAHKAGKCQLCGKEAKGYSVTVTPPGIGEVKKVAAEAGKSYWCNDCANKKVASYERAIAKKRENGGAEAKKAAPAKPKAKRSRAKR